MQPYVIRQGDYLLKIAHKFGFDADTVWQHEKNEPLRKAGRLPTMLAPGDLLYIPDQSDDAPPAHELVTGATNTFTAPDAPTIPVAVKFVGADTSVYASKAYSVKELDQLTGLTTTGEGVATFPVPVTLSSVTIVFSETGEQYTLMVGGLDPAETKRGAFQRLQNLGLIGALDFDQIADGDDLETMRTALDSFHASNDRADVHGNGGLNDQGTLTDEIKTLLVEKHGY